MIRFLMLIAALLIFSSEVCAGRLHYGLKPERVAEGVYVFIGATEHFNRGNGGNIVNTGFLIGSDGVVVIDTGPSLLYGEQMRRAIKKVTDKPIKKILITHSHPDHFLGNRAFKDIPIAALPATNNLIGRDGEIVAEGLYRMVGDWMHGTEVIVPKEKLSGGPLTLAGRDIELYALSGHSDADLAVLDKKTGVLFAGDLTFFKRTPTFPSASIEGWLKSLTTLSSIPFEIMIPGHGPVVNGQRAIAQTRAYILWLEKTVRDAVGRGLDMNETMDLPIPAEFANLTVAREEYVRSVGVLYPKMEAAFLPRIDD